MKITFLGAAREVTGSKYLVEIGGDNYLVDCGMEQGPDMYENAELPVKPATIKAVLLTHAHVDHSGLLPLLVKRGFKGPIYVTKGTRDLATIMLLDSAGIQESEAQWRNKKAKRGNKDMTYEPLYTREDALRTIDMFEVIPYDEESAISPDITLTYKDAGHILGSASILIRAREGDKVTKVVFSGDIGNKDKPIIKDPEYFTEADYAVMESTYGMRTNEKPVEYADELPDVIVRTLSRGGNVVIPSFAVGRMQELLYAIRRIKSEGRLGRFTNCPVYVDSPLSIEATKVFSLNDRECFDSEARALMDSGINPLQFPGLVYSVTTEQSKSINEDRTPKIILSASGMCEAGRIRHHLKHNLWRHESTIVFVGYQVAGTIGRQILDGANSVSLMGEKIDVNAEIVKLSGTSSHGDTVQLMDWVSRYDEKPKRIFVTHGDEEQATGFRDKLISHGYSATAPYNGCVWNLDTDTCEKEGNAERLRSKPRRVESSVDEQIRRLNNIVTKLKDTNDADALSVELEKLIKKFNA